LLLKVSVTCNFGLVIPRDANGQLAACQLAFSAFYGLEDRQGLLVTPDRFLVLTQKNPAAESNSARP
jgi:hypothetical protein